VNAAVLIALLAALYNIFGSREAGLQLRAKQALCKDFKALIVLDHLV